MAEYISFQPSDYFSTLLYSYAASPNAITGAGFAPDAVSLKGISGTSGGNNWYIGNTVMGNTKTVKWNSTAGEVTTTDSILSFDADGYTLGADATANCNSTGTNYVGYNWKAGTTSGLSGGTITPTAYSISATAGQSVIAYTGTGATATIPHGLGAVPGCIIVKNLGATAEWQTYNHKIDATAPEDYTLQLSANGARFDTDTRWNDTAPTSSVFTLAGNDTVNGSAVDYIAYVFTEKKGYSKFGSYIGNGDADGTFVYTGFRPAMVIFKKSTSAGNDWGLFDNKRDTYNPEGTGLKPNDSAAEYTATNQMDFLSNGFKLRSTGGDNNTNGATFIYLAFAEFPTVSSNDIPGVAR